MIKRDNKGRFVKGNEGHPRKHSNKTKKKMSKNYNYHTNSGCFKKGDNIGTNHRNWKGGREVTKFGYVLIYSPNHPKAHKNKVFEHIIIMEGHIGRHLLEEERIHHINGNKEDNSVENLILCNSQSEHIKLYHPDIGIDTRFK